MSNQVATIGESKPMTVGSNWGALSPFHKDNASDLICHYTTLDGLTAMSTSKQLWLSRRDRLNDPAEFEDPNIWSGPPGKNTIPSTEVMELLKQTRNECFIFCGSSADTDRAGYALPTMWGLYGGNHGGACLLFDRQKLLEAVGCHEINDEWHGRITYDSRANSLWHILEPDKASVEPTQAAAFALETFKFKDPDWSHEREFRIVLHLPDEEATHFKVPFPSDALQGIVFGSRAGQKFRAGDEETLKAWASSGGILTSGKPEDLTASVNWTRNHGALFQLATPPDHHHSIQLNS